MKKALSALLCLGLVALSPGPGCREALAMSLKGPAGPVGPANGTPVVGVPPVPGRLDAVARDVLASPLGPVTPLPLPESLDPALAARLAQLDVPAAVVSVPRQGAADRPAPPADIAREDGLPIDMKAAPAGRDGRPLEASAPVSETLNGLPKPDAAPGDHHAAGRRIEDALLGTGARERSSEVPGDPTSVPMGTPSGLADAPPDPGAAAPAPDQAPVPAAAPAERRYHPLIGWLLRPIAALRLMMHGDKELAPYVERYRTEWRVGKWLMIVDAAMATAISFALGEIVDAAAGTEAMPPSQRLLLAFTVGLVAVNAVYVFVERFHVWLRGKIGALVLRDFRADFFRHLTRLPLPLINKKDKAQEVANRLSDDMSHFHWKNVDIPISIPHYLVHLAFSAAMLIYVHWILGLLMVFSLPLFALLSARFGNRLETLFSRYSDARTAMVGKAADALMNAEVMRTFGSEEAAAADFDQANEALAQIGVQEAHVDAWYTALLSTLGDLVTKVMIVILGSWALFEWGNPTLGALIAMQGYAWGIKYSIEALGTFWTKRKEVEGATKRVLELYSTPAERDAPGAVELPPIKGDIRFEGVTFGYSEKRPVVRDLTFEIEPGTMVAFIGPKGSGKTTILRLLGRLYDPQKGRVTIDGQDIRGVTRESLRKQLAIVPQESPLSMGSVRKNLLAVAPGADEGRLRAALATARADFLFDAESFPEGLDTQVGRLSGGQRQLVAIARAILRDPRLLLLDEATSALDNVSERDVQWALEELMEGRTTIVIAHKMTTTMKAKRIFVLDAKGRIVQVGTHEELLKKKGLYRRLWRAARRK